MTRHPVPILIILLLTLLAAAVPVGAADVIVYCDPQDQMNVRVHFYTSDLQDGWIGAMVSREVVGECLPGVFITPEPLVIPDGQGGLDVTIVDENYDPTHATLYRVWGVNAEMQPVELPTGEGPYTHFVATCTDVPLMRGRIFDLGEDPSKIGIELCAGDCWEFCVWETTVGVGSVDPAEYEPFLDTDTVVEIFGEFDIAPPENSVGCMRAVRVEEVADCSGSVATVETSWGHLKGLYR